MRIEYEFLRHKNRSRAEDDPDYQDDLEGVSQDDLEAEVDEQQLRLRAAIDLLEKNPKFPGAVVQIHEDRLRINRSQSAKAERLSEKLFKHCLRLLDSVAKAYLGLVVDIPTHKAFHEILCEQASRIWMRFSGIPIEAVQPSPDFYNGSLPPVLLFRDRFEERVDHLRHLLFWWHLT